MTVTGLLRRFHFQPAEVMVSGRISIQLVGQGDYVEIAVCTEITHHRMYGARGADDGIHQTSLNAFGTADAIAFAYPGHARFEAPPAPASA